MEEMASQVGSRCEELRVKHQTEFSSWLLSPHHSASPSEDRAGPVLASLNSSGVSVWEDIFNY